MFERILVPLDGTTLTELALPYAEAIASQDSAQLVLAQLTSAQPPSEGEWSARDVALVGEAQERAAAAAQGVVELGNRALSTVAYGRTAGAVIDAVRRWQADLVVLAVASGWGYERRLPRSVGEQVLSRCPVPVLLITPAHAKTPPAAMIDHPRLIVPLDGSHYAQRAVGVAAGVAQRFDGQCVLLQALQPYLRVGAADDCAEWLQAETVDVGEAAHEYLRGVAREVDLRRSPICDIRVAEPAAAIVQAAQEHGAALVIMSTHARTGWARWLFGSVAAAAVRRGSAPVLLVGPSWRGESPARSDPKPCTVRRASVVSAVEPARPVLQRPGTSPVERLYRTLEAHRESQETAVVETRQLASSLSDPVAKFLLNLVADGKARQHELVQRIEASLRDAINWTHSRKTLPEGRAHESARTVNTACELLRQEREAEREARQLAKACADIDAGLDRLLLEINAGGSAVHQRILRFAVERLRANQASADVYLPWWRRSRQSRTPAASPEQSVGTDHR